MVVAAALALLAGAFLGMTTLLGRQGLDYTDALMGTFLSVTFMTLVLWAAAPWLLDPAWIGGRVFWVWLAVGLAFPAFSQRLQVMAVERPAPPFPAPPGPSRRCSRPCPRC